MGARSTEVRRKKMEQSINFILPGMYEHATLNLRLLQILNEHPEMFYPNVKVGAAYGNFQFCIFDGGRIFSQYRHTTVEEISDIVKAYNSYGVPVRLIFTNPVVPETSFKNRFGQAVLKICDNSQNEIVVNNPKFEEYLRENYPDFGYISSTTKCLNTPDKFTEELDRDYKMICLDYNLNKNHKMLEAIPEEKRNKCEFLVNAICPPGCPNRKEHYRLNGLYSLSYGKPYATQDCPILFNTLHPSQCGSHNNITPEEIYNVYAPKGFVNFKLEGRTLGIMENMCNYVKYMVKPEYQFYVMTLLLDEEGYDKVFYNDTVAIIPRGFQQRVN